MTAPYPCVTCQGDTHQEDPREEALYCTACDWPEYECVCGTGMPSPEKAHRPALSDDPDSLARLANEPHGYRVPPKPVPYVDPGPPCHFCLRPLLYCCCIVYKG